MINKKNDSQNFWSGYAMGILSGSAIMYAFATKSGRETLKKIMAHTETLEQNLEDVLALMQKHASQTLDNQKSDD